MIHEHSPILIHLTLGESYVPGKKLWSHGFICSVNKECNQPAMWSFETSAVSHHLAKIFRKFWGKTIPRFTRDLFTGHPSQLDLTNSRHPVKEQEVGVIQNPLLGNEFSRSAAPIAQTCLDGLF